MDNVEFRKKSEKLANNLRPYNELAEVDSVQLLILPDFIDSANIRIPVLEEVLKIRHKENIRLNNEITEHFLLSGIKKANGLQVKEKFSFEAAGETEREKEQAKRAFLQYLIDAGYQDSFTFDLVADAKKVQENADKIANLLGDFEFVPKIHWKKLESILAELKEYQTVNITEYDFTNAAQATKSNTKEIPSELGEIKSYKYVSIGG